jgi:ATP-dependent Clp protease adapter protein ClpS
MEKTEQETDCATLLGKPSKVILFNDEDHTKRDVVFQIKKAIHCSSAQAYHIMLQSHEKGRAIVWTGHRERCEYIAGVLEVIQLGVKIEPA